MSTTTDKGRTVQTGELNPAMLVLSREARGFTQKQLSTELGVSQGKLSKIESGLAGADAEFLDRASNVLGFPVSFFCSEETVFGPGVSEFYHRKKVAVSAKLLRKAHAEINLTLIHLRRLFRAAEIDDQIPRISLDDFDSPEEIARAVRAVWSLPTGPVADITELLEDSGGMVVPYDFGTAKVDAICRTVPGLPPVFFVNRRIPVDRYRWTLAHELGHAVMHRRPSPEMENEADRFASEFLMPARQIGPDLVDVDLQKLARLKPYWKTSMASLLYRAKTLGKISERKSRHLWMRLGQLGYRRREPAELDLKPEHPSLFQEIVDLHTDELGYSLEELAASLDIHQDEFEKRYALRRSASAVRAGLRIV